MPKKRGTDVQLARGRLKGVLQELVTMSEGEASEDSSKKYHMPLRGRPPKRFKKESNEEQPAQPHQTTCVMKLFDRSVDLAKYRDNSPLYPICRAWMLNQPRSNKIKNFRDAKSPSPEPREECKDLVKKIKNGSVRVVTAMPPPKLLIIPKAPSPIPEQRQSSKHNINLDYETNPPRLRKEHIMVEYIKRWRKVKKKWSAHYKAQDQKYVESFEVLDAIYDAKMKE